MRKLKLQVQISVDGFVAGEKGEMDWMTWNWDDSIKTYVNELTDSVDTILLGRNMTDGFVKHWSGVATQPEDEGYTFANKMIDYKKYVFSNSLDKSIWKNTTLVKGNFIEEIKKIKEAAGKDIIVYGGASFVSSLVSARLIDEYYLFINPSAIGNGLSIFNKLDKKLELILKDSTKFGCGIVINKYVPK